MKDIVLAILGFGACITIAISDDMLKLERPLTTDGVIYAVALVLSVVYIHWILRRFLLPFQRLHKDEIKKVHDFYTRRYAKGFLAGTIGLGYFLLGLHVLALLDRSISTRPSFLASAIFFIALGTLAQARAAVQYFCQDKYVPKKEKVEQTDETDQ